MGTIEETSCDEETLITVTNDISTMKPVWFSERCGVSSAENEILSVPHNTREPS